VTKNKAQDSVAIRETRKKETRSKKRRQKEK